MSNMDKRLYKGRAALNVLANSVENAKEFSRRQKVMYLLASCPKIIRRLSRL